MCGSDVKDGCYAFIGKGGGPTGSDYSVIQRIGGEVMIQNGERDAVTQAICVAEIYGYGNLISHLRRQWTRKLVKGGLSEEAAEQATAGSSGYKTDWLGVDLAGYDSANSP